MEKINSKIYKQMLTNAHKNLSKNKEYINYLNVFPVPDGDTGSNVYNSFTAAYRAIHDLETNSIGELSDKFSTGFLYGASGNSGVIHSQIFSGINEAIKDKTEYVEVDDFILAFEKAKEYAYSAVIEPKEGTILTVARILSEEISERNGDNKDFIKFFETASTIAKQALDKTPDMLPVLKEAGLVDSGGYALWKIIEAFALAVEGKEIDDVKIDPKLFSGLNKDSDSFDTSGDHRDFIGKNRFDVEFFIIEVNNSFDKNNYMEFLNSVGDSAICIHKDDVIKTHIHTDKPDEVIREALKYGDLDKIEIHNLKLQVEDVSGKKTVKKVKNAAIAVSSGEGISKEYKNFGADVIKSRNLENPTIQDFINIIEKIDAETYFLLPNDKNIILTCEHVAKTLSNKNIVIIKTKTMTEGYSCLSIYSEDCDPESYIEETSDILSDIKNIEIVKSIRNATINGVVVKKNEFIAISGGNIIASNKKLEILIEKDLEKLISDYELVTIFEGLNSSSKISKTLKNEIKKLEKKHDITINLMNGQQDVYTLLIGLE